MGSKWIDIEKELPNPRMKVLVGGPGFCGIGEIYGFDREKRPHWVTFDLGLGEITHWMPLPESPKKMGSSDEE